MSCWRLLRKIPMGVFGDRGWGLRGLILEHSAGRIVSSDQRILWYKYSRELSIMSPEC